MSEYYPYLWILLPLVLLGVPLLWLFGKKIKRKKEDASSTPTNWMGVITKLAVVVLLLSLGSCFFFTGYATYKTATTPKPPPPNTSATMPQSSQPSVAPEYPTSGEGYATKEVGLEAWLDPMKTYLRPTSDENPDVPRAARYVFAKNKKLFFDDTGPSIGTKKELWWKMPAGNYLVYPLKEDKIYFRWWQ